MMDEIDYIDEIDYWLADLMHEIKDVKYNVGCNGITNKKIINNRCNNLILYTRALRDKIENGYFLGKI